MQLPGMKSNVKAKSAERSSPPSPHNATCCNSPNSRIPNISKTSTSAESHHASRLCCSILLTQSLAQSCPTCSFSSFTANTLILFLQVTASNMGRALLFDMAARWWSKETVAVVTGSNKGLGQAIVRELARNGVTVVSTARDAARGLAAVDSAVAEEPELKEFICFHQLDVTADESVAELASYLQSTFGGVDILINNAAMQKYQSESYEDAVDTIETNYFGTRRVTEKLLPMLRASPFGARIIMVSSQVGQMENFGHNEYLKTKIQEALELKDEKIVDAVARKYLEDVKSGREKEENWGKNLFQYRESKLFMNMYTRVLAAQLASRPAGHKIYVNALCPGAMKTDLLSSFVEKVGATKAEAMAATVRWRSLEDAATAVVSQALFPVIECPHGKFLVKDLEERIW